ncbi:MAG: hypothetical protein AMXMBFR53_30240 [Gemmatimonadota bacterium]
MSAPNLWERARWQLAHLVRDVGEHMESGTLKCEVCAESLAAARSLLSETEGVEAVIGNSRDDGFGPDFDTLPASGARPALLLLLPEPESHE